MSADRWKIALIIGLVVVATVLHYGIDLQAGAVHDVLLRSYYLPIVLAGLWFGARGGLITALGVSIVFFPHAFHGWQAPYTFIFRLVEILMYHVIGGLTGVMSSRAKLALAAERTARLERESAYEDLKEKTRLLFAMEEALQRSERLAALGRMSAGLAHEIRNPLASIKTSVEMLQEKAEAAETGESSGAAIDLLQVLGEETDRLNRIVTEFLRFARAEVQHDGAAAATCLVGDVVARTEELLRSRLGERRVDMVYRPTELAARVSLSEDHLHQVFLNLFLNAIDAMPEGGTIRIALEEDADDTLVVAVEDTGPGIDPEVARSVFDPFFSTREGGVGLGLSIVARLLEVAGGEILLDGAHDGGARWLVTLPREPSESGQPSLPHRTGE